MTGRDGVGTSKSWNGFPSAPMTTSNQQSYSARNHVSPQFSSRSSVRSRSSPVFDREKFALDMEELRLKQELMQRERVEERRMQMEMKMEQRRMQEQDELEKRRLTLERRRIALAEAESRSRCRSDEEDVQLWDNDQGGAYGCGDNFQINTQPVSTHNVRRMQQRTEYGCGDKYMDDWQSYSTHHLHDKQEVEDNRYGNRHQSNFHLMSNHNSRHSCREDQDFGKVTNELSRTEDGYSTFRKRDLIDPCLKSHEPFIPLVEQEEMLRRHISDMNARMSRVRRLQGKGETYNEDAHVPKPSEGGQIPAAEMSKMTDTIHALAQAFLTSREDSRTSDGDNDVFVARMAGKEILKFDGDYREWDNWYGWFMSTSKAGKFSQEGNLIRLRQCLTGEAKKTVSNLLFQKENVPLILDELKSVFGRPDQIIKNLMEEASQLPRVSEKNLGSLVSLAIAVKNLVAVISTYNRKAYLENPILLDTLCSKLTGGLQLSWGRHIRHFLRKTAPDLQDFSEWLDEEKGAVLLVPNFTFQPSGKGSVVINQPRQRREVTYATTEVEDVQTIADKSQKSIKGCHYCGKVGHSPGKCYSLKRKTADEVYQWAVDNKVCLGCLDVGHIIKKCPKGKVECGQDGPDGPCRKTHHPYLHRKESTTKEVIKQKDTVATMDSVGHSSHTIGNDILLKVVEVMAKGPKGEKKVFAMLDCGSSATVMDSKLAAELGLKGKVVPFEAGLITGVVARQQESKRVTVSLSPLDKNEVFTVSNIKTMDNLGLRVQSVNLRSLERKWPYLKKLNGVGSMTNARPLILIGADHHHLLSPLEVLKGESIYDPEAHRTRLGWLVFGNTSRRFSKEGSIGHIFHAHSSQDEELTILLQSQSDMDALGIKTFPDLKSQEVMKAEKMLNDHTRFINGRYEVPLLWKDQEAVLPPSKEMALHRHRSLMLKMQKDPSFADEVRKRMQTYFEKGYARKLTDEELEETNSKVWYLPLFGIKNPNKKSIRMVFDAAAKAHGRSLNDALISGGDYVSSLIGVLCKFRERKVAFMGDIADMFHRVQVRKEDQSAQRFFFAENIQDKPTICVMTAMTFGSTCSPSCAQFVKNLNASKYQDEFPEAVDAIHNRHYVDDYCDSVDTPDQAVKKILDVVHIHSQGGFEIRRFVCSDKNVLLQLPPNIRGVEDKSLVMDCEVPFERVLGLKWNPNQDNFVFDFKFHKVRPAIVNGEDIPTRRDVLKYTASVYDPLGFLAHLTIKGKLLNQEICMRGLGWDEKLNDDLNLKWLNWLSEVQGVNKFSMPRFYGLKIARTLPVELHVFCDASEKAYATVAYFRQVASENVTVAFVMSKSRICPASKVLSVPRKELQAALIASRIAEVIKKEHSDTFIIGRRIFWSDSKTVLCWVRGSNPNNFSPYVRNRVGEIMEATKSEEWKYVPTGMNVSDEATRDNKPCLLEPESRWCRGPQFLFEDESQWPKESQVLIEEVSSEDLELKKECVLAIHTIDTLDRLHPIHFSSWTRLQRVTAWVLRYIQRLFESRGSKKSPRRMFKKTKKLQLFPNAKILVLEVDELDAAEKVLLKRSQQNSFGDELLAAQKKYERPSKDSRLVGLAQFLDEDGLLRVGGRTAKAQCQEEWTKHPIILDHKDAVTRLIIRHYHWKFNHVGQETVHSELRLRFWIVGAKTGIRRIWSKCVVCQYARPKVHVPMMGQLPQSRLTPSLRAFTLCGLDGFGPIEVREKRSILKRWVLLFRCLNSGAIHLEKIPSLSTDSCIMAIRRMVNRRGCPNEIHCDNGKNFVGAKNEFTKALNEMDHIKIKTELSIHRIKWFHIPSHSPHFGGAWESMVKSVKSALSHALKEKTPSEEILDTLLVEAEGIVNSRPLAFVSNDIEDPQVLTPNCFIIGTPSLASPPGMFVRKDLWGQKQWRAQQLMTEMFWSRWIKEVLPLYAKRRKWNRMHDSLRVGDLVIILDEDMVRNTWTKGRVTKVFPGEDGQVRVVEVKTAKNIHPLRRAVTKIAKIDVEEDEDWGTSIVVKKQNSDREKEGRATAANEKKCDGATTEGHHDGNAHTSSVRGGQPQPIRKPRK